MKAFGTVRCPWCGAEFDTGGIEEAGACVVECDRCGFEFEVESELLISCEAGIPAELEGCDRCGCWDIDGFCGWGMPTNAASEHATFPIAPSGIPWPETRYAKSEPIGRFPCRRDRCENARLTASFGAGRDLPCQIRSNYQEIKERGWK